MRVTAKNPTILVSTRPLNHRRTLERKLWDDKKHALNFSARASPNKVDRAERNAWIHGPVEQGCSGAGAGEALGFADELEEG